MWPAEPTASDERSRVRWNTGGKDGVGTAAGARSRIWFTLTRGFVSEVFYPSVDHANIRRLYLAVTLGDRAFIEDGLHDVRVSRIASWAPAYRVRTPVPFAGLSLRKQVITDTDRAVLLLHTRLRRDGADAADARVFVILEPHLDNTGEANDTWLGEYKGRQAVLARRSSTALALLCSHPFVAGACAYVGKEDTVADLRAHGRLTRVNANAVNGNVQAAVEVQLRDSDEFTLALGFGASADHAAQQARASLEGSFPRALRRYVSEWRQYHAHPRYDDDQGRTIAAVYDASVTTLRTHQDKERAGAITASMAIPWGDAHGDRDSGGYHLVWPRDLVETAGALLAVGRPTSARRVLSYLMSTQESDGMWPQNMWLDGTPNLRGVQLDEVALPILLAGMLARHRALAAVDPWPMVRAAAGYLVRCGPVTPEDRWEEEGGYSPYTIAAQVAALLTAAAFADDVDDRALATFLRETADDWNASLERWTYVRDTPTARRHHVDGYYVRLTPPKAVSNGALPTPATPIRVFNHQLTTAERPYEEIISPDALALVRFGLRTADDPRIRNTVAVIDAELRTKTKRGPAWHRYTGDGYGEQPDGSPFISWGVGRAWPLLTGERAHYELARGRPERARHLLRAMAAQANPNGLLPEQIWDAEDLPERGLFNGRPTGSAMPLVWAHAEFLKLCRSIRDGRVFDLPVEAAARYCAGEPVGAAARTVWRDGDACSVLPTGHVLRVEARDARCVEWKVVGAAAGGAVDTVDVGIGLDYADLPTTELSRGDELTFCVRTAAGDGKPHRVRIVEREV